MTKIPEELIIRFINNTCNDEELVIVRDWLDESEDNVIDLFRTEQAACHASCLREDKGEHDRVKSKLNARIAAESRRMKRRSLRRIGVWASGIAAMLAVVFVAGFYLARVPEVRMIHLTSADECVSVTLPDSTKVYLNRNSSLSYPERFAADSREVSLQGEGYFEVSRDCERPFRVTGEYLNVEVLGTRFNFVSRDTTCNNVSLIEGAVEVLASGKGEGVVLEPGQKAVYSASTGYLTVQTTNAAVDASWHNRIIPFHNANINEIIDILRQLYGIEIELEGDFNLDKTYSGVTVYCDDLDSTLATLANTIPIRFFKKDGKTVVCPV